jgi:hypothetical protein
MARFRILGNRVLAKCGFCWKQNNRQKIRGKEKYLLGGTPRSLAGIFERPDGFGRRRLGLAERALRHLGRVEQALGVFGVNGADEHTIGDARNKVADSIAAKGRGHGGAVEPSGSFGGKDLMLALDDLAFVRALVDFGTAGDREVAGGDVLGGWLRLVGGGSERIWLDHVGFSVTGGVDAHRRFYSAPWRRNYLQM